MPIAVCKCVQVHIVYVVMRHMNVASNNGCTIVGTALNPGFLSQGKEEPGAHLLHVHQNAQKLYCASSLSFVTLIMT